MLNQVNKDISWVDDTDNKVHGLMPGFPVGFLIVKGIVIRISHGTNTSSETKTADAASSASSGGFLCFSCSRSSSSSSSLESASYQA
jgi:hypothetical protein